MRDIKKNKAFTLVELLVVISIIALLLAVLMPALSRARQQGKSIVCRSNIKQLTLATRTYAVENKGKMMPFGETVGQIWYHLLAPYMGKKDAPKGTSITNWKEAMPAVTCPEAMMSGKIESDGQHAHGSAKESWSYLLSEGSYGLNYWLMEVAPGTPLSANVEKFTKVKPCYFEGSFDTQKGNIPLMGDCTWLGGWPGYIFNNAGVKVGSTPRPITPSDLKKGFLDELGFGQQLGRFCIDRHAMAVNIGFIDGHVEKVPLAGLWGLKWNKLYVPESNYVLGTR